MSKRLFFLVCVGIFLFCQAPLSAQLVPERLPVLLINEVHNENASNENVFIELVVLKSDEIAHNPSDEYAKIIVDDNNVGPGLEPGFLAIKPEVFMFSKPGDIIVLHGSNTNTSAATDDVILLDLNSHLVEKYEGVPSSSNASYENGNLIQQPNQKFTDFITFTGSGDVIQAKVGSRFTNKINQNGNKNLSLSGSDQSTYSNLPPSLGTPNNAANAAMIANLKSAGPPKIKCSLFGPDLDDVNIIADGGPAFETVVSSLPDPLTIDTKTFQIFDLDCGEHLITVTNSEENVMTCRVFVPINEHYKIDRCKGQDINVQEILDCNNIQSDCIIMQVGDNNPEKFSSIGQIDPFPLDMDEIINISFGDKDGNVIQEITITVRIVKKGDSCDDGNACTEGDAYNDNCNCVGGAAPDLPQITEERESPCSNEGSILQVANQNYAKYTWKLQDRENPDLERIVGSSSILEVDEVGLYRIEVETYGGCELSSSYFVTAFSVGAIEGAISASKDRLCGNGDEAKLEVIADYDEIVWSTGETSDIITVSEAGTYSAEVSIGPCNTSYFIEIKSTLGNIIIEPEQLKICPGEPGQLDLVNLPVDFAGEILWSPTGHTASSISVLDPDIYTVTITDNNSGCEFSLETEVKSSEDFEYYRELLLSLGFDEFELSGPPTLKESVVVRKNSVMCDVTGSANMNLMFKEAPLDGSTENYDAYDFLCQYHGETEYCSKGFFFSGMCPDATATLNDLLSGKSDFEGIVIENAAGVFFCFARSENSTCKNYSGGDHEVKFTQLLTGILCAIKSNSPNYTPSFILEGKIRQGNNPPINRTFDNFFKGSYPLFDGVSYEVGKMSGGIYAVGSGEGGIHVSNYENEPLDLSDGSIKYNDEISEWCGSTGSYAQISIDYESCRPPLIFTVKNVFGENLSDVFFKTDIVLNAAVFNQNSLDEKIVEQLPLCYLNCDRLCHLYDALLESEYELGSILWLTSPETLNLMDVTSECVIDCFDGANPKSQRKKTNPWLDKVDGYWNTYGGEASYPSRLCPDRIDLLRNLSLQFFSMDTDNMPDKDDSDNSGISLIENPNIPSLFNGPDYHLTYDESAVHIEPVQNANTYGKFYFESQNCDYYNLLYPVHLGREYNFVCEAISGKCDRAISDFHIVNSDEGAVIYLPGIYLGFAVERHEHDDGIDQIFNGLDVLGLYTGWTGLSHGVKAFRSSRWLRALGLAVLPSADIVSSATSLFLNNSDYCEEAENQLPLDQQAQFNSDTKDFCDKLRIVSFITSTISLGNAAITTKSKQMDELIDAFDEIDNAGLAEKIFSATELPDPNVIEFTELGTMRRLATIARWGLPESILAAFAEAGRTDIIADGFVDLQYLKGWETVTSADNVLNLIPELSKPEIDATTAKQFFDAVFDSHKNSIPNSIGVRFSEVHGGMAKVWGDIDAGSSAKVNNLRNDFNWLSRFDKWMKAGLDLNVNGDIVELFHSGNQRGLIRNRTLLSTAYLEGFSGSLIGEVINGCGVYKSGSKVYVKRQSDLSGLSDLHRGYLTLSPKAHCPQKHGITTSNEALLFRTETGIAPNGELGPIVNATRFYSNLDIKNCINTLGPGTQEFGANLNSAGTRSVISNFDMMIPIGEGIRVGDTSISSGISRVTAVWWKDSITNRWFLRTMFPVM